MSANLRTALMLPVLVLLATTTMTAASSETVDVNQAVGEPYSFHIDNQRHATEETTGYLRSTSTTRRRRIKSSKSGERYSKDRHDTDDNVFDRHDSSSSSGKGSKSTKSSKSSKSGKSSKRKGGGKGGSHPSEPSAPPIRVPTISMEPSVAPPPSDLVPTRPRTENPVFGPTNPPAGSNEGGECTPDSAGLFGSQLGFAEVYEYGYEITTIPSVTAEEVNLFVLPSVEVELSQGVLEKLFESCNPDTQTSVIRSPTQTLPPAPTPLNGYALVGDTYVYQPGVETSTSTERTSVQAERYQKIRGRRRLQFAGPPQQIEGVSTQPADEVVEGEECVTQDVANLNCFVIRGSMTTYSREKQTDATQAYIQNAIDTTLIETTDDLQDSDFRIIDFDYRDTERYPLPPAQAPDDDEMPTEDDDVVMEPTQSPVVRPDSRTNEFGEPWHYALIAVGVVLIAATIYLCVRRPNNILFFMSSSDEDDKKDIDDESAVSSEDESDGDFHREAAHALAATNLAFGDHSTSFVSASASSNRTPSQQQQLNAFGIPDNDGGNEEEEEGEESYELEVEPDDNDNDYEEEEQSVSVEEQSVSEGQEGKESYEEEEIDAVNEEEYSSEEDEEMDDDGAWIEDEFEDEPTYDERLNDETSAFGASQEAGAAAATAAAQGFIPPENTRKETYEVESTENSPVQPKQNSTTSFSVAIARAMNQAAGEKSETDFSPFDEIHDDNIYGATTGEGPEYEFRQTMPMNSSHHADSSGGGSSEFEEVSIDEEEEEGSEEYEIEYATESSGEEFEEDYISDEEEEESFGSYQSR